MSASAVRVGRYYTAARRHPWVLGKVADWRIPLGPYTPAQIFLAVGGGFLLVKTISWWSWMGPIPVAAWALAIWAVRRPKIKGRAPMQAALGWLLLAWQPHGGRIGGRAARDRAARPLVGGFVIEDAAWAPAITPRAPHGSSDRAPGRGSARHPSAGGPSVAVARTQPARPISGVQQLLALAEQGGGVR
ncbi:hypothetical protein H1V43_33800 [Streptomyces sp. PSKA54]|uniref:Uncharacterized protein n=1 Tax=Streptomyces himalayensis subsp. aureolus TaxID=2758039 RepID=A0A7W2D7I5_9ACTN|nr:hypothetical protein [Streptomyces himalayensis]MBA4866209.1 hypothetical protein [Streptomyces himalayensis subsp. aureolus]